MDSYAQHLLEKAEQRSRALGISNAGNFPGAETTLTDTNRVPVTSPAKPKPLSLAPLQPTFSNKTASRAHNLRILEKSSPSDAPGDARRIRQFSAFDKENKDMGIEINILTDKQVEVQVQIEDRDNDDAEKANEDGHPFTESLARIRDTSRNRLQRLGALYSNSDDLSSPIHRTEEKFHAGDDEEISKCGSNKPQQRLAKLAALASSINQWEDDTHLGTVSNTAPPKPDLPSRCAGGQQPAELPNKQQQQQQQQPPTGTSSTETRKLNWDPKVINSLEAQGFQRRDTSTTRLAYDYTKDTEAKAPKSPESSPKLVRTRSQENEIHAPVVSKLASTFQANIEQQKNNGKFPVKTGLVSGRTAVFEQKAVQNQPQTLTPVKDPIELSLRERMKLFERNKGEALLPKAALGMAPSISQIRKQDKDSARDAKKVEPKVDARKQETKVCHSARSICSSSSSAAIVNHKTSPIEDNIDIRGKVAALVARANSLSPEGKIANEVQKQRQQEMQQLVNRFNKQKQLFQSKSEVEIIEIDKTKEQIVKNIQKATHTDKTSQPKPPPPPPPKPENSATKRRSPAIGGSTEDDSKRARKVENLRLYPTLSDLDTTNTSDTDNCCTTMSARSAEDEPKRKDHDDEDEDTSAMSTDDDIHADYTLAKARIPKKFANNDSEVREDSTADISSNSFGREIMQVVQKNENKQEKVKQIKEVRYASQNLYIDGESCVTDSFDSSMNSSCDDLKGKAADVDDGDDDFTQDSADEDNENTSRASRGSKGTTASNSFSFRKTPGGGYNSCKTIDETKSMDVSDNDSESDSDDDDAAAAADVLMLCKTPSMEVQPVKSELKVNEESDNMVTLVHTVSFYRRQQTANSANSTPVRKALPKLCYDLPSSSTALTSGYSTQEMISDDNEDSTSRDNDEEQACSDLDDSQLVQDKIKKLLDEVCKQQQVIAQTSQALNLCAATIEFSGSTESVEGERHLLVATHRRQACLDEVQRLRVEKSLRPVGAPREKGRLTVKEITLPLRQDYIRKLAADTISGHHLVCLLKYNEKVLATKTVPTLPGLLAVKFPDLLQLENAFADFRVTLEVYGMTAQREVLPHEVKYHINLKKCGIKTPKKKNTDNRLVMPPVQSPAGPHVVRTPALVQYGHAIFSLREIQRTTWSLTQVLGVSPLEGVVHMKVNCELSVCVEHKGFLTMFEDISGFGAWHRRWCHLNGTMLNYWKYPDDEKKRAPMGSIDLYTCSSQKVLQAPRDICARLHTLLLECQRPAKDTDRESLIIVPQGRTTIVRHLLSADTKEEREEWCAYFNKALTLLRAWGPPQ